MVGTRRLFAIVSLTLAALTTLASCGDKGPTAAQAGQQLKTDISSLLRRINARDIRVIDDGSREIPCEKDKARRGYAVTAMREIPGETEKGLLNLMVGSFVGDYKLDRVEKGGTTAVMRNKSVHTNVTLEGYARNVLKVSGSTDCLRAR